MVDFQVSGADDFLKLSKALKAAGQGEIRKELNKGLREAAKPLIKDVRAAAAESLPQRGGLAKRMSKRPTRVVTRTGKDPGVKIVMPKTQPGYNEGVIRHPVFEKDKGSRKGRKERGEAGQRWVEQRIDGEWFDGTILKNRQKVIPPMEQALGRVVAKVIREVGR